MKFKVKKGNILEKPLELDDAKFLVAYSTEGNNPLFAIMEHGGVVSLTTPDDDGFDEILRLAGV